MSAVHDLIRSSGGPFTCTGDLLRYTIAGNDIIHLYDYPHIWKAIRNNLMKKDLRHTLTKRWEITDCKNVGGTAQYASWDHIQQFYDLDTKATQRLAPNLTPEHLNPEKYKMKVSYATQVFSATVGTSMLRCCKQLDGEVSETAYAILFFNDLFDSLNGGGDPQCETLKGSINDQSIHFAYWEYALSVLQNMYFVDKTTKQINNQSSVLKKLESTIKGYMEITKICMNANVCEVSLR